jgi:hypothetical protein
MTLVEQFREKGMRAERRNVMNPETVKARLADIEKVKDDDEMAHSSEDSLHEEVLSAIANGTCENPAECARLALTSSLIEFSRWCA